MVKWSGAKERINERGPYILVGWSCINKRNQSMRTLIFGRMVVYKKKKKLKERRPHIFVKWSCANKTQKSVGNLNPD